MGEGSEGSGEGRECVWCGATSNFDREHIIGQQIAKMLNTPYPAELRWGDYAARQGKRLEIVLENRVCKACNKGWMRKLDNLTMDFMRPERAAPAPAGVGGRAARAGRAATFSSVGTLRLPNPDRAEVFDEYGHRVFFGVGPLVCFVLSADHPTPDIAAEMDPEVVVPDAMLRVWPTHGDAVRWPPSRELFDRDIANIARKDPGWMQEDSPAGAPPQTQ